MLNGSISELDRLQDYCAIDSTTLNKSGVQSLQKKVASELESLGFQSRWQQGDERFADLLIAERKGALDQFISIVTHTDTVRPNAQPFTLDERIARGSGVIDNKGGLVVGLSALRRFLHDKKQTRLSLRFICSPNEEMGSIGFTQTFSQFKASTVFALGLEPALDNGSIINQRRGNRWYNIEVKGREAHAGRSFGHDANAAHDLAKKITRVVRLNDHRHFLSVNIGRIDAGQDKHNIVCGFATAKLDTRFASFAARDRLHRKIMQILNKVEARSVDGRYQTTTRVEIVDDCPPFSVTRASKKLSHTYTKMITQLEGGKVTALAAGGAGDVNYLSTDDNIVLDGLGPVGGEMHTAAEFLQISTLKTRSEALAQFLNHLQTLR